MWNDKQPIYQQLKEKIIAGILEGLFAEGAAIPSIRQVAEQYQLNPLTVSKAYQMLVDDAVIEKHRGLGMFVKTDARVQLLGVEKKRFMEEDWPKVRERIKQLGLAVEDLPR